MVRDLRKALGETQGTFAERFHKVRTYITNTEKGTLHAEEFVKDLIREFPEEEKRIRDAYERSLDQHSRRTARKSETPLQRKVEAYIRTGRFGYAQRALTRGLNGSTDDYETHWIYDRLHVVQLALGKSDAAAKALEAAIECAVNADMQPAEIASRDRLASRHQVAAQFQAAHDVLDAGLLRFPSEPKLWLRKGKVHWYEQNYSAAYAALTTALKAGAKRSSVLHARGQVLAEWGSFDAAIEDIEAYLACTRAKSADIYSARSARAYAWGQLGDLPRAMAEFDELEARSPTGAWQHYRRALCYVKFGKRKSAISYLQRALERDGPPLNPPRKRHAEQLLAGYGVSPIGD